MLICGALCWALLHRLVRHHFADYVDMVIVLVGFALVYVHLVVSLSRDAPPMSHYALLPGPDTIWPSQAAWWIGPGPWAPSPPSDPERVPRPQNDQIGPVGS